MDGTIRPDRVAVYIRWSTDDQADGTTLEVQRESCLHYLKSQGWEYRDELCFIDDGYSGGTLERPAMERLRAAVRGALVDCVVVYKLDRLSRSVIDTVNLVLREWDGKCHVKSTREPIDTASPAGKMFFYMLVSYAEWERSVIRERTMSGKQKRAEQGRNPGIKFPYGYTRGAGPGEFAVCAEEAAVVRRIFREYAGGQGLAAIAGALNEDGVPTRSGAPWRAGGVQYILRNAAYRGALVYRQAQVEGALPAIVTAEQWQAAQAAARPRAPRRGGEGGGAFYLLSGIARCRCGAPLVGGLVDGRYRTYSCSARRSQGPAVCDAGFLRAGAVEAEVLAAVLAEYDRPDDQAAAALVSEGLERERAEAAAILNRWEGKAAAIGHLLRRLHAAYDTGELSAGLYQERVARAQADLAAAQGQADRARARLAACADRLSRAADGQAQAGARWGALARQAGAGAGWGALTPAEQREMLRHAIARLTLWRAGAERDSRDRRRVRQVVEGELTLVTASR